MEQETLSCQEFLHSAGCVINNKIYLFTEKENTLMTIDMRNWEMKYLHRFVWYNLYCGRADKLLVVNNRLYKLPLDGKYIEVFSLKSKEYQRIETGFYDKPWNNFVAFEFEGQFLYVFLKWKDQVIKINVNDYRIEKVELCKTKKKEYKNTKFTKYSSAYRYGSKVWLFEENSNQIDIYNMENDEMEFYILPHKIGESRSISKEGEIFYILTSKNQVYILDGKKNNLELLWNGEKYYGKENYFGEMLFIQQKIILLPMFGQDIVIYDCRNRKLEIYNEYPEGFCYFDIKWGKYINCFQDEKCYYYPMRTSEYILEINKASGKLNWRRIGLPSKKDKAVYLCKQRIERHEIMDDNIGGIDILLDLLKGKTREEKSGMDKIKQTGYVIWEYIKA